MWTNPTKVSCSGCGASNLYVEPQKAKDMGGWKWIGYPGDPMRRGDVYYKYIFKPGTKYPYEHKPLPMIAAPIGAARPGGVEQAGHGFVPQKKKGGK